MTSTTSYNWNWLDRRFFSAFFRALAERREALNAHDPERAAHIESDSVNALCNLLSIALYDVEPDGGLDCKDAGIPFLLEGTYEQRICFGLDIWGGTHAVIEVKPHAYKGVAVRTWPDGVNLKEAYKKEHAEGDASVAGTYLKNAFHKALMSDVTAYACNGDAVLDFTLPETRYNASRFSEARAAPTPEPATERSHSLINRIKRIFRA